MPFSQAIIREIKLSQRAAELRVSWQTAVPGEFLYQVYLDQTLAWVGSSRECMLPLPARASGRSVWVDVGTVDSCDPRASFADQLKSLESGVGSAVIEWNGGSFSDPTGDGNLSGYRVYGTRNSEPTEPPTLLATVPAYYGSWISDGYGLGGYGMGGYGRAGSAYSCRIMAPSGGEWTIKVVPLDLDGEEQVSEAVVTLNLATPPRPPARGDSSERLKLSYDKDSGRIVTLNWLASPSI